MAGAKLIQTECYQEFRAKHINLRGNNFSLDSNYTNIDEINNFGKNHQENSIETWELRAFYKIDQVLKKVMPETFTLIILYFTFNIISLMINGTGYKP